MGNRKYTNMKEYGKNILEMREEGRTYQEIADELGLEKKQIENWIVRYNRKQREQQQIKLKKKRGRPRIHPLSNQEEYEREIARLRMENDLLRDFLQLLERK